MTPSCNPAQRVAWTRLSLALCVLLWLAPAPRASAAPAAPLTAGEFFEDTSVWEVEIEVTPENYANLEPTDGRDFGADFAYVHGRVRVAGQSFEDVGLRYKGNSSYSTARGIPKKSFKIDFNHFIKGQKFLGLTKVNLNNNVLDPSQIREALACRLWRRMNLPASRTAFARVTLTVPGRFERKFLGLYTMVEQVDGTYLSDRFGSKNGLLLKPERCLGLPFLGESFGDYESVYVPKSQVDPLLAARLIDFTRLIHQADDEEFATRIGSFVDLGQLARFTAVHTVLSHLDSFLLRGHNFYLYLPSREGRFAFLPWDVNSTFASHRSAGSPEQQFDLSVDHPFAEGHRLLERLMTTGSFRDAYLAAVTQLVTSHFSRETVKRDMEELRTAVEPTVREDPFSSHLEFVANFERSENSRLNSHGPDKTLGGFQVIRKPLLIEFVEQRHDSIAAQLAGNRKGHIPTAPRR